MGQAFLRWQMQGKDYSPDIVIFVFQPENLDRNVNVFRPLYTQGGVIFSKPRFILDDDGLALINSPAMPPEEIMDAFESFDSIPCQPMRTIVRARVVHIPWQISADLPGWCMQRLTTCPRILVPRKCTGRTVNEADWERKLFVPLQIVLPPKARPM